MINVKKELLEHVGDRAVSYVSLALVLRKREKISDTYGFNYEWGTFRPKGNLKEVLEVLTITGLEYNNSYASQKLFGYIWYEDGTWSDRYEYEEAEWWRHVVRPDTNTIISTDCELEKIRGY
tara:strand:- start:49 stop:414 length:366 start_codon:yes stop_codon:yes gene_type:complete